MEENKISEELKNNVELKVTFEVGRVYFTLAELNNLHVGQIVPCDSAMNVVYLLVNGVRIGEGLLVDVQDRIGFKITKLYNSQV